MSIPKKFLSSNFLNSLIKIIYLFVFYIFIYYFACDIILDFVRFSPLLHTRINLYHRNSWPGNFLCRMKEVFSVVTYNISMHPAIWSIPNLLYITG